MSWIYNMIILPSSESLFYDIQQYHKHNQGSGINASYPNPSEFLSGVYGTYYANANFKEASGIFAYNELDSSISSASGYNVSNNFNSFNNYIHYYPKRLDDLDYINESNKDTDVSLRIPYSSSFKVSAYVFNPYTPRF